MMENSTIKYRKSQMLPDWLRPLMAIAIAAAAVIFIAGPAVLAEDDPPRAPGSCIGRCNNVSDFNKLLEDLDALITKLGQAKSDADRKPLQDQLVSEYGENGIEGLIRYREPLLIPVLSALLEHEKWYVRRLAIYGLERNCAVAELSKIAARLDDDCFLVREIAAISICTLYIRVEKYEKDMPPIPANAKALKEIQSSRKKHLAALNARLAKEPHPYVKAAIEGAIIGLTKTPPVRIHKEILIGAAPICRVPNGEIGAWSKLLTGKLTPFLAGGSGKSDSTKGWAYPVSVYPREIISGLSSDVPLKPLPARNNSLHFGHDCGWYLEGTGIYAIADGVVKMVKQQGDDWGGLIVVEHQYDEKSYLCALYGHSGMWVFAKDGPVKKGQLLGVQALSFSPENGGHGAHCHFGMFSGRYQMTMCYGRGAAGKSIEGWLVPAVFLGPKVEGKDIDPESY
ncbi:MAG: peptidoglycan DD-metalloendopeptidase family protein [Planctomycetota bacterium]